MSLFRRIKEVGDLVEMQGPDGDVILVRKEDTGPGRRRMASNTAAGLPSVKEMEQYIRRSAQARGHDPDVAVRVARSEGLAPGVWQSNIRDKRRGREPSYGPFQLLVGGENNWPKGLGNEFVEKTGLDPRHPSTWKAQVDFAMDKVGELGWSPWYGAAKVGVSRWKGINRGAAPQLDVRQARGQQYRPSDDGRYMQASFRPSAGARQVGEDSRRDPEDLEGAFGDLMREFEDDPLMQPIPGLDDDLAFDDPDFNDDFDDFDAPNEGQMIGDIFSGAGDAVAEAMQGYQGGSLMRELDAELERKRSHARQRYQAAFTSS